MRKCLSIFSVQFLASFFSKISNIETAITLSCVAAGGNISWQLLQGGAGPDVSVLWWAECLHNCFSLSRNQLIQ